MAKTRFIAIISCSYATAGLAVSPASAMEIGFLGFDSTSFFSMLFDSWRILLALGILAGLINHLARQHNREALGIGIPKPLIAYPNAFAFGVIALVLIGLSATSLPTFPLLVLAQLFVLLAWSSYHKTKLQEDEEPSEQPVHSGSVPGHTGSILRIELGSGLLSLAESDSAKDLVSQIASLREMTYDKMGLRIPSIQIKDDLQLPVNAYRIYLRNGVVAEGTVYKDRYMVINDGKNDLCLDGIESKDPVFGLPVLWITEELRDELGELFVQVMDPVSVLITHVDQVVKKHASELLCRDEVIAMVNDQRQITPRLVGSILGKTVSLSRLHKILQALLEEKVSIKDFALVLENASDSSSLPLDESVEKVRSSLRRQICANVATTIQGGKQIIRCVELPNSVEDAIARKTISTKKIKKAVHTAAEPLISEGLPIVVVSSEHSRRKVKAQVAGGSDEVFVLGKNEIVPEVELQVVGTIAPQTKSNSSVRKQSSTVDSQQTVSYAKAILSELHENAVKEPTEDSIASQIEMGLSEIKSIVGDVVDYESAGRLSPFMQKLHRSLVRRGIDSALATAIVEHVEVDSTTPKEVVQTLLMDEIVRRIPRTIPPPSRESSKPTVIALVGPTGVGKTTTIAKLATKFRLQQGRSVSLVTADTYRVAAVNQLQQYADLFDATFEIAGTREQMKYAMEACATTDVVLIDTAGRSAGDDGRIQETANILEVARPNETHLVLSAATSKTACQKAAEGFALAKYDRVIVTKLDEIALPGETLSVLCSIGKPLSWFTDGQDVSSHLDLAKPSKLLQSVFA